MPIGGGAGYPQSERARRQWITAHSSGIGFERAATLLDRYGTVASEIIDALGDEDTPLASLPGYSSGELVYLAATEHVVHLADVLLRRTAIAFTGTATSAVAAEIAAVIAPVLGWDAATQAAEVEAALAAVHAADPAGAPIAAR